MTTANPTYRPREYLSYSTLMDFIRCPRRYFYKKCGIAEKEERPEKLYGTAMHRAVPELLTSWSLEAAVAEFERVWDPVLDDDKHSRNAAIRSLAHLFWSHSKGKGLYTLIPPPPMPAGVQLTEERSPWELLFVIDVGLRVPILGWIDGWCRHRDTGELWAWELKTMGRMTASMFDGLEFDPQVLTYILVCRQFTDERIQGVMYEGIHKDRSKANNLTHPVRVEDHMVEGVHGWLRYWGELLLACEDRALDMMKPAEDEPIDVSSNFPKNFAGCTSRPLFWQPGSACEFMNLCRTPDWRQLLPYYDIKPEHRVVELTKGVT